MRASLVELARSTPYGTDKSDAYLDSYEELLARVRDDEVRVLELGIHRGGSLRLWRDYFPRGVIAGLDLKVPVLEDPERIRMFEGRQDDAALLARIRADVAPDGFDVIIDDCSHVGELTARSFGHLFAKHLKPGGIYAIEDWGTGYWGWWPDGTSYHPGGDRGTMGLRTRLRGRAGRIADRVLGPVPLRSHQSGMVGFVKQLVDECGRPDFERANEGSGQGAASSIARLIVRTGLVIVVKTDE